MTAMPVPASRQPDRVRFPGDGRHHLVRALEPSGSAVLVRTECGKSIDASDTYAAEGGVGDCWDCAREQEQAVKWWPGKG